ncbi:hypothetical protein ACTXT7_007563 [Hymenolepis weldensis]
MRRIAIIFTSTTYLNKVIKSKLEGENRSILVITAEEISPKQTKGTKLPFATPASVTLQPGPSDSGKVRSPPVLSIFAISNVILPLASNTLEQECKPCGVDYELRAYIAEECDEKPQSRLCAYQSMVKVPTKGPHKYLHAINCRKAKEEGIWFNSDVNAVSVSLNVNRRSEDLSFIKLELPRPQWEEDRSVAQTAVEY